jgi:hypothetical protein
MCTHGKSEMKTKQKDQESDNLLVVWVTAVCGTTAE